LRDYGTPPQIWGGDPDFRLRWGAERRIRRGGGTGSSGLMKDGRDEANGALSPIGRIQRLGTTHRKARSASAAARGAARSASSRTIGSMSSTLVAVLREVRRVLRPRRHPAARHRRQLCEDAQVGRRDAQQKRAIDGRAVGRKADVIEQLPRRLSGLKPKDLVDIPWRVAFAQQDDGWWLRGDNVWSKPNSMPESCKDRPLT